MKLNPPMWSLAIEVGFYALLPVIGSLCCGSRAAAAGWRSFRWRSSRWA